MTTTYTELLARSELMAMRNARMPGFRAAPVTARGKDSRETILMAAADLLSRIPAYQVTTHGIADAAGVNIATLYRYFDDVTAILRELTLRREIETAERLAVMMAAVPTAPDWRAQLRAVIQANVEARAASPGGVGLGASLLVLPELAPIVEAGFEIDSQLIALALSQRDPSRGYEEWLPIVRVPLRVSRQLLADRFSRPHLDERHLELVVLMIDSYLANFLPD